ncbi:2,3-bisphosphoglycerate-dependent phosphoglycerate mutase, partial [Lactobacillus crispatus]
LHVCLDRVMPFWEDHIAPDLLDGKNVIIAAHGNSLRALTKYIENISDEDIMNLEMKTGEPVVYTFDENLDVVNKEKLDD